MPLSKTFTELCDDAKTRIAETTPTDVEARIASPDFRGVVIDVREQDEYRAGHLPTARGIGRGILEYHIADEVPDTDTEIVLYCRGGNRSALAADSLRQMGYTNVFSMRGGFRAWDEENRAQTTEGEPIVH
ncbi:MAG: sulfurtransferase [Armatimonadetes bacterium]|nr:sulfurtransferase [Armatimonadota bacterium]